MATLAALLADVYSLTNRSDLVAESTLAVKAATLKAHQSDNFPRDKVFTNLALGTATTATVLLSTLARWRSFNAIQRTNSTGVPFDFGSDNDKGKFKILDSNNLFDDYSMLQDNIAYIVGASLYLRCAAGLGQVGLIWYQNPDLTNAADMGWISDSHPYCIVFEAARQIFKTIGYDEQAAVYKELIAEQFRMLRAANILAEGS